jgi:hypothetical protein
VEVVLPSGVQTKYEQAANRKDELSANDVAQTPAIAP